MFTAFLLMQLPVFKKYMYDFANELKLSGRKLTQKDLNERVVDEKTQAYSVIVYLLSLFVALRVLALQLL